jgi:hypothetical protein
MQRVKESLASEWKVDIIHVNQETNRCVDIIANMNSEGNKNIALLKSFPINYYRCWRLNVPIVADVRVSFDYEVLLTMKHGFWHGHRDTTRHDTDTPTLIM